MFWWRGDHAGCKGACSSGARRCGASSAKSGDRPCAQDLCDSAASSRTRRAAALIGRSCVAAGAGRRGGLAQVGGAAAVAVPCEIRGTKRVIPSAAQLPHRAWWPLRRPSARHVEEVQRMARAASALGPFDVEWAEGLRDGDRRALDLRDAPEDSTEPLPKWAKRADRHAAPRER